MLCTVLTAARNHIRLIIELTLSFPTAYRHTHTHTHTHTNPHVHSHTPGLYVFKTCQYFLPRLSISFEDIVQLNLVQSSYSLHLHPASGSKGFSIIIHSYVG